MDGRTALPGTGVLHVHLSGLGARAAGTSRSLLETLDSPRSFLHLFIQKVKVYDTDSLTSSTSSRRHSIVYVGFGFFLHVFFDLRSPSSPSRSSVLRAFRNPVLHLRMFILAITSHENLFIISSSAVSSTSSGCQHSLLLAISMTSASWHLRKGDRPEGPRPAMCQN